MTELEGPEQHGHRPRLRLPAVAAPRGIVLVLHGGQPTSTLPVVPVDPVVLRMLPFAADVQVRSRGRIGAAVLRHAVRGWNGERQDPVADARWALTMLRERYPALPIGLIGHSMGGRTALELVRRDRDRELASVVALAPWVTGVHRAQDFARTPLLVVHGRTDTMTDPNASHELVASLQEGGSPARLEAVAGGHTMLWRPQHWHRTASRFTIRHLLAARADPHGS